MGYTYEMGQLPHVHIDDKKDIDKSDDKTKSEVSEEQKCLKEPPCELMKNNMSDMYSSNKQIKIKHRRKKMKIVNIDLPKIKDTKMVEKEIETDNIGKYCYY